jgi:acyl-CoA thioesterase FadM
MREKYSMATTDSRVMVTSMRPCHEGANIRTWIGFKHLMYMVEEAVLDWFRRYSIGPQRLYHDYGLGLEVVDSSVQFPALVEVDDEIIGEVASKAPGRFSVRLRARRSSVEPVVVNGNVRIALVREKSLSESIPAPEPLAPLVTLAVSAINTEAYAEDPRAGGRESAFTWSWQARYFHCHYSGRVQHSAYIRALEEVVDRFLADRGISIARLLQERDWIPVVSRARVTLLADARMGEMIHTTFAIEEILKGLAYNARMDCYVRRGETLTRTATARILHGYAIAGGDAAGQLAPLDEATQAALAEDGQ